MSKAILVRPASKHEIMQNLNMLIKDAKKRRREAIEELKAATDAFMYTEKEVNELERELEIQKGNIKKEKI